MNTNRKLVSIKSVCQKLSMSRSSIYRRINPQDRGYDPSFPTPIKLGDSMTRWEELEIEQWLQGYLDKRN